MTRIVIAEDHSVTRSGLELLLGTVRDIEIVARVGDGKAILAAVTSHHPELLILDLGLPGTSGLNVLEQLRAAAVHAQLKVIVFSGQASGLEFKRALQLKANGVISKSDNPEDILAAIQQVIDGGDDVMTPVVQDLLAPLSARDDSGLTEREREVLVLVAQARSSEEIAASLGISPATVKKHRENLMRKLGAHSAVDAARIAARLGLIDPNQNR